MTPRILFLGAVDHANLVNRIARAINAYVGDQVARVFTSFKHQFGFQEDVWQAGELEHEAARADWIVSSGDGQYPYFKDLRAQLPLRADVKIAVTHAGTAYRVNPIVYNRLDAELQARVRFIGCDSLYLARQDPRARPYFGTCDVVEAVAPAPLKPRVTHSPTTRTKKGTAKILPALERCASAGMVELDLIENVSPDDVARRRREAHVHVDQLQEDVGGFGQSAIEAMGAGCAVLADMRFVNARLVSAHVPVPPIVDVRTGTELEDWVRLFARERDVLARYREAAWVWSKENSAPEKVAEYWLKQLASVD